MSITETEVISRDYKGAQIMRIRGKIKVHIGYINKFDYELQIKCISSYSLSTFYIVSLNYGNHFHDPKF